MAVLLATRPTPTVGGSDPQLFTVVCLIYWIFGGLMAFGGRGRWHSRRALVFVHTFLDTAGISALLFCSGGVSSGLGILLVIPVGAMSLLAEGRASLGVAALAALGLLTQQILAVLAGNAQTYDYLLAGIARRGGLPGRAHGLAGVHPAARERSAGASSGTGSGESGAAVAIHRAAPAREHPGGGPVGSHPAHQ